MGVVENLLGAPEMSNWTGATYRMTPYGPAFVRLSETLHDGILCAVRVNEGWCENYTEDRWGEWSEVTPSFHEDVSRTHVSDPEVALEWAEREVQRLGLVEVLEKVDLWGDKGL